MNHSIADDGTTITLRIRGELDALSAPELRPVLDTIVDERKDEVLVDLSDLRLIDSSGVGALVSLYKRVRQYGGNVRFNSVTAQPLVIFKLLRLDVVFGLTEGNAGPVYGVAPELAPETVTAGQTGRFETGR